MCPKDGSRVTLKTVSDRFVATIELVCCCLDHFPDIKDLVLVTTGNNQFHVDREICRTGRECLWRHALTRVCKTDRGTFGNRDYIVVFGSAREVIPSLDHRTEDRIALEMLDESSHNPGTNAFWDTDINHWCSLLRDVSSMP